MRRFDYACPCGNTVRRMRGSDLRCRQCGGKSTKPVKRVVNNNVLIDVASGAIKYQNRFPYVSTAFPFGAKGAKHVGPLRKCVIESAGHEERMRGMHGYVGEKKVVDRESETRSPAAANRAFYG